MESPEENHVGRIRRAVRQKLESLESAGVTSLRKGEGQPQRVASAAPELPRMGKQTLSAIVPADSVAVENTLPANGDRSAALAVIRAEVQVCTKCSILVANRTQTVFGVGSPQARLVFCGEAPGADEDKQGEPFVGRAGQLLNKIIEACTLKREEVYILNTLKCRPPDNRPPAPGEVANCRGFLTRQLEIIGPEFICCLGTHASQAVLRSELGIGKLRGKFHSAFGAQVICTYHPAYLLRNPAAKKDVWEDMKVLMRKMGVELA